MMKIHLNWLCVPALLFSAPVSPQDLDAAASLDQERLASNFEPDPQVRKVTAGGNLDASQSVPGCNGFVSEKPLVRLTYSRADDPAAFPLFIHAYARGDTTLLVNAPDGKWYCNDDGFNGQNPMLIFGPAMSGDYTIWLGTFSAGEKFPAILAFSEVGADIAGFEAELSREAGR